MRQHRHTPDTLRLVDFQSLATTAASPLFVSFLFDCTTGKLSSPLFISFPPIELSPPPFGPAAGPCLRPGGVCVSGSTLTRGFYDQGARVTNEQGTRHLPPLFPQAHLPPSQATDTALYNLDDLEPWFEFPLPIPNSISNLHSYTADQQPLCNSTQPFLARLDDWTLSRPEFAPELAWVQADPETARQRPTGAPSTKAMTSPMPYPSAGGAWGNHGQQHMQQQMQPAPEAEPAGPETRSMGRTYCVLRC